MAIERPKTAYYTMQCITSVFDDRLKRIPRFPWYVPGIRAFEPVSVFGYQNDKGRQVVTVWLHDTIPSDDAHFDVIDLVLPTAKFSNPVWADLVSGEVYEIPPSRIQYKGRRCILKDVPVRDSVILLASAELVPTEPASGPGLLNRPGLVARESEWLKRLQAQTGMNIGR